MRKMKYLYLQSNQFSGSDLKDAPSEPLKVLPPSCDASQLPVTPWNCPLPDWLVNCYAVCKAA